MSQNQNYNNVRGIVQHLNNSPYLSTKVQQYILRIKDFLILVAFLFYLNFLYIFVRYLGSKISYVK